MKCRHCHSPLNKTFIDLGIAPPSNAYLVEKDLKLKEKYFPLKIMVCENCWLVQTLDYTDADELFDKDYAYFSSTSSSFLKHAKQYSEDIIQELSLNKESFVIEVAANDGYLLKNFKKADIPCLGIEPTNSTARAAMDLGIPILQSFFSHELGKELKKKKKQADLIIGNNVFAHVPDINSFTRGLKEVLKPEGTITLEFPHLMKMMVFNQFDTIYHEHFSYLSLTTVQNIFNTFDLRIYKVGELTTHGGSLRIYGCHKNSDLKDDSSVKNLLEEERRFGIKDLTSYQEFSSQAEHTKSKFIKFLEETSSQGKKVVGYGAAAKGNTILNFAGIKNDKISYVCDAAIAKQNKYLPGSHIPILPVEKLLDDKADYIIIFPWNIADEVKQQLREMLSYETKFVTFIPDLNIENI
jgi:SAM-dependent methyltransferase